MKYSKVRSYQYRMYVWKCVGQVSLVRSGFFFSFSPSKLLSHTYVRIRCILLCFVSFHDHWCPLVGRCVSISSILSFIFRCSQLWIVQYDVQRVLIILYATMRMYHHVCMYEAFSLSPISPCLSVCCLCGMARLSRDRRGDGCSMAILRLTMPGGDGRVTLPPSWITGRHPRAR